MILASGSAPAKLILFGEHAVVYGKPAIAIPLSTIRAYADIEKKTEQQYAIHVEAIDIGVSSNLQNLAVDHPIRSAFRLFYDAVNRTHPQGIVLSIHSDIPVASGFGSGAAVGIAIFRALAAYEKISLSTNQLSELTFEIEKIHHGTPSGIDNTVIAHEQPVWYIKDKVCEPFKPKSTFHLLIANSGISAPTAASVAAVRTLFDQKPERTQAHFDAIEEIAHQALVALEAGDPVELGRLMTLNHNVLQQLTVSSLRLDEMVRCALDAGAFGAKLSGGGRGGNIIILANQDSLPKIRTALEAIGVNQFFTTHLGE
jgi:mevalonate kinase